MNNNHTPNPVQYIQCATLIAKVIISEDRKFTKSETELANEFFACNWKDNVTDFPRVIPRLIGGSVPRRPGYWNEPP